VEALAGRGVTVVREGPSDAVVVGWTRGFTFDAVDRAARAVRAGARLIGTNEDPTFPTPDGLVPGAGALLAAVSTAAEATPEVAGKPHRPTADAIVARVGAGELRAMVGDRPSTDGALADQLGIPFALVFSGVTREGDQAVADGPWPAATARDLRTLVADGVRDG
jgi:ribonucleotide monophosphatase NagD (HAD superfamily)